MPSLISDAVDAYVVRRLNARLQFLLMQRARTPRLAVRGRPSTRVSDLKKRLSLRRNGPLPRQLGLLHEPSIAQTMSTRSSITRATPSF